MSDTENDNPPTDEKPDTGQEPQGDEKDNKPDAESELPDWARKELTRARGEAANYRTQLREAQDALTKAKTPEEYATAVKELSEKNATLERSLLVTTVAREHNLPADLAELLKGDGKDELVKHAKQLAKYATPASPKDPKGGLDPTKDEDPFDPKAFADKYRRRSR